MFFICVLYHDMNISLTTRIENRTDTFFTKRCKDRMKIEDGALQCNMPYTYHFFQYKTVLVYLREHMYMFPKTC